MRLSGADMLNLTDLVEYGFLSPRVDTPLRVTGLSVPKDCPKATELPAAICVVTVFIKWSSTLSLLLLLCLNPDKVPVPVVILF